MKDLRSVVLQYKIYRGIAEVTDTIEQNDFHPFVNLKVVLFSG
jgi:hypothetical protein